jgi:hypothetical protein
MSDSKSKRELLRDKVVNLVKEFVKNEGDITQWDIEQLFGKSGENIISPALVKLPISFCQKE